MVIGLSGYPANAMEMESTRLSRKTIAERLDNLNFFMKIVEKPHPEKIKVGPSFTKKFTPLIKQITYWIYTISRWSLVNKKINRIFSLFKKFRIYRVSVQNLFLKIYSQSLNLSSLALR
jgi:hypothetical protein